MRNLLAAVSFLACVGVAQGCELAADFDRSKIPGADAAVDAGAVHPVGGDEDAGSELVGVDAATGDDAGIDDVGTDDAG